MSEATTPRPDPLTGEWKMEVWDFSYAFPPFQEVIVQSGTNRLAHVQHGDNPYTLSLDEAKRAGTLMAAAPNLLMQIKAAQAVIDHIMETGKIPHPGKVIGSTTLGNQRVEIRAAIHAAEYKPDPEVDEDLLDELGSAVDYWDAEIDHARRTGNSTREEEAEAGLAEAQEQLASARERYNRLDDPTVKLAMAFSVIVRKWLTPEQVDAVNTRNASDGMTDKTCATHEFIDANQAMLDALEVVGIAYDPSSQSQTDLTNAAWTMAKRAGFDTATIAGQATPTGGTS